MMSSIRQNYHEDCEASVNTALNAQQCASYAFLSMATHCDRHDVALHGIHKLMKKHSDKIKEDSEKLLQYQNERGGRVVLKVITKPSQDDWGTGKQILDEALKIYTNLNKAYFTLHDVAETKNDPHLGDYIEDQFLNSTVDRIKEFGDLITQLKRAGDGVGEYIFDHELSS